MINNHYFLAIALLGWLGLSGCATGRSYQSDLDTLNDRINALQSEMVAKDEELARMREQASSAQSSQSIELARAEAENQTLKDRVQALLEKLESQKIAQPVRKVVEESDLK